MKRVRFEPIDVDDIKDFEDLYGKLREIMNSLYKDDTMRLYQRYEKYMQ